MAESTEPEIATRAPEHDAAEDQPKLVEQHVEQGQGSLGEHCVSDRPSPDGVASSGDFVELDGIETYISKPVGYPQTPSKLLLLLSSGTGIHSMNNQLQADAFAKEGFVVIMPDQFNKDPAPKITDLTAAQSSDMSLIEKVKSTATDVAKSFLIDMWLARQTAEKVTPVLERVIRAAKEEYGDAFSSGSGLYAVGYCFGGKYILQLASAEHSNMDEQPEGSSDNQHSPIIKAGALAHGTLITSQDFMNVKAPVSIVAVENDQLFPDAHRKAGVERLEKEGIDHEVKVYSGVPHGFAVVGEYANTEIRKAQGEAFQQILAWLKSH